MTTATNHAGDVEINAALAEEQRFQKQAEEMARRVSAVNLDEVAPEPVMVSLKERVAHEAKNAKGEAVTRYKWVTEQHEIETYVPTEVYLKTLHFNSKYGGIKTREMTEQQLSEMFDAMQKLVLEVWQLTEPEMTRERLRQGLDFMQTQALFSRFFGVKTPLSTRNP